MVKRRAKSTAKEADPHRQREARKYANPIPSREFILDTLTKAGAPLAFKELAETLQLHDDQDLIALERRLGAMVRDGQLVCNRNLAYCLVNKRDLIAGRVIGHADGFGFVRPDEGGDDLYLYPKEMRSLFHGDRVVVSISGRDRRGRLEGTLVEILERNTQSVVGRLYQESGVGFVTPDNRRLSHDIIIPSDRFAGAEQGQIVVAEITDQPTRRTQPIGRVVEVLGDNMAAGMETDISIRTHDLPVEWSEEVLAEIAGLSPEVPEEAWEGRKDLRDLALVTIDGADSRDFDDAVYCERKPKGWKLYVCIADVSSYVRPGTALDREAYERGNSVYFPDRVVPMLPEILSNGLCSLNPEVDRLCMTAELYINQEGQVTRSSFYEGVMRSHARLTYDKVASILIDSDPELCEQYAELLPHLHELYQLFQVLLKARRERGAIDFETTETRFQFNDQGRIEAVVPVVRNDAHKIIEECMLAANVAAARFFERRRIPGLFRIHDTPSQEKLSDLREFLGQLGLKLPGGDKPTTADYAKLLANVQNRPDRRLIQTVLLRSMQQAMYSSDNAGHFGLSYDAYTHFTSPIRRYPDLMVHRIIKHVLTGGTAADLDYSKIELQQIAEHCSGTERRADEATRDAEDWLKCEFMRNRIGEEFDGTITSVNSFGIFVELDEVYVDGLVHITALDNDFYHFDPIGYRLHGERTGMVYRLGDRLRIRVAAVNLDDRKIDFVLAEEARPATGGNAPRKKKSSSARRRQNRQNAASTQNTQNGQAGSAPQEAEVAEVEAEAPQSGNAPEPRTRKSRSRRRRRKNGAQQAQTGASTPDTQSSTPVVEAAPEAPVSAPAPVPAPEKTDSAPESPAPKSRARQRREKTRAPAQTAAVTPEVQTPAPEAVPATPEPATDKPAQTPAAEAEAKPRTRRRRKSEVAATQPAEAQPQVQSAPEPASASESGGESAQAPAGDKPEPRARRTRKKATEGPAKADTPAPRKPRRTRSTEQAALTTAAPAAEPSATAASGEKPKPATRRRRKAGDAEQAALTSPTPRAKAEESSAASAEPAPKKPRRRTRKPATTPPTEKK